MASTSHTARRISRARCTKEGCRSSRPPYTFNRRPRHTASGTRVYKRDTCGRVVPSGQHGGCREGAGEVRRGGTLADVEVPRSAGTNGDSASCDEEVITHSVQHEAGTTVTHGVPTGWGSTLCICSKPCLPVSHDTTHQDVLVSAVGASRTRGPQRNCTPQCALRSHSTAPAAGSLGRRSQRAPAATTHAHTRRQTGHTRALSTWNKRRAWKQH